MRIRTADVELHVVDEGDPAAPPVLLLHGITQSTRTWDWLVPHLVDRHRVLRLDFRGHGESGRTPGAYGFPGCIADARAVCEQVAEAPCLVVGHSLGGGTAAALAQQHPDLVRAAVLEDPALSVGAARPAGAVVGSPGHALLDGFALLRESVPALQASGITVAQLVDVLEPAPSPTGPPFGELLHPDALVAMAAALLQLDATVLDGVAEGRVPPAYDHTRPLPVPTLLVTADPSSPDVICTASDVEQIRDVSPQVEVHVLEGAGHLIHDERAHRDRFLELTLGFLAGAA
jgi:pimeloyl-ACP methyl ester carboxylesterase